MAGRYSRARVLNALRRALALRCPRCGATPLFPDRGFRGWFAMTPSCAVCGLRFERAQGYWVGAIYVSYVVTVVIALTGALTMWNVADVSPARQLWFWLPFVVLFPLWFFRYSRSLWLAFERLLNPEP
jgi:uncharacterized protein (DUF983 family)